MKFEGGQKNNGASQAKNKRTQTGSQRIEVSQAAEALLVSHTRSDEWRHLGVGEGAPPPPPV